MNFNDFKEKCEKYEIKKDDDFNLLSKCGNGFVPKIGSTGCNNCIHFVDNDGGYVYCSFNLEHSSE